MDATVAGADLILNWDPRSDAVSYSITRQNPDGSEEAPLALGGSTSSLTVSGLTAGATYEWRVTASLSAGPSAYGVLRGGIDVALVEDRGRVLVCVADSLLAPLGAEIDRLLEDMAGDGWRPSTIGIPAGSAPPDVKAAIVSEHATSPVNAVLLLGDLPVPYSGAIAPDAHANHRGAWPADAYYGEVDGSWTDAWRVDTTSSWPRNHNTVGDGKFDQNSPPSDVDLMVGRVDLSDLPAFAPKTEVELLRGYLDRDHAFRHTALTVPRQALVDDHLSSLTEGVSLSARNGFAAAVGRDAVQNGDWPDSPSDASYLLGAGFGAGSWSGVSGVTSTSTLASSNPSVVFSILFGSYFGDWDYSNSILRAAIAGEGATLASAYSGRPQWQLHALGLGAPLGKAALESQNASPYSPYYTSYYARQVHVALHGDPTLRLFPRAGATSPTVQRSGSSEADISWQTPPSDPALIGYHVYRGDGVGSPFTRLNAAPITGSSFTDPAAPAGGATYQVRALYREVTGSGSFINSAQGAFATMGVLPMVELVPGDFSTLEGGAALQISATRSGDLSAPLVVALAFSGTASPGDDFSGAAADLTFPAGEHEASLTLAATDDGEPEPAEELLIAMASPVQASYAAGTAEVCVTVYDDGYGGFADQWFSGDAHDAEIAGEGADPDGDGVPNLIEYAIGSAPLEFTAPPLEARGKVELDGEIYRLFAAPRAPTAEGVQLSLNLSPDMGAWTEPIGVIETATEPTPGEHEIEFRVPEAAFGERTFINLVAEQE